MIKEAVFSIYLGFDGDSEATFGGFNPDKIKDSSKINYHTTSDVNSSSWIIEGVSFKFGSLNVNIVNKIVISTFWPSIEVTMEFSELAKYFLKTNSFTLDQEKGIFYTYNLDNLPDLIFNILDTANKVVTYTIPPDYYTIKENDKYYILISFSEGEFITLGDPFLRRYASFFSY